MALEDPFFVVKEEVSKALNKTRELFKRLGNLNGENCVIHGADIEWSNTELRNAIRSIEWDLEDLEETISIVERNPKKFKIGVNELLSRKQFIQDTKNEVQLMKERLIEGKNRQNLIKNQTEINMPQTISGNSAKYSRLSNMDSPEHNFGSTLMQQEKIMEQQNGQLDQLASSMGTLKNMSRQIGTEVDEQAVMLDDFGHEMEQTHGKMENTLNKIARITKLTNDSRQWVAISILSAALILVIILYFVI